MKAGGGDADDKERLSENKPRRGRASESRLQERNATWSQIK